MVDSRHLSASTSFSSVADTWAKGRGLIDNNNNPTSVYPVIIGMPSGSVDLGAFNLGKIGTNRTIKQALQDLETLVSANLLTSNNLSDLQNVATARNNLQLGSSATYAVGTSGGVIPLLNTNNTWSGAQTFAAATTTTWYHTISGAAGQNVFLSLATSGSQRWQIGRTIDSGSNTGADFYINRWNDAGTFIDVPFAISRSTGVVTLSKPLPITSGGTGATTQADAKAALGLGNVNNTADADKPISTATQTALNTKYSTSGGTVSGFVAATQYIASSTFLRASQYVVCDGGSSEGGQVVLGYKNVNGLTGQANSTWNIDVDSNNALRIFTVKADGTTTANALTIDTNNNPTFSAPINGSAYPRRSDGTAISINWTGQTTQPSYIIGSNDGLTFYPFNPGSVTVNNATNLNGVVGGNTGGYIRRTTDASANGALSNQLVVAGDSASDNVHNAPIQIREIGLVGSSNTSSTYAPGILFNWSNYTAGGIKMFSDGTFRFLANTSSVSYRAVYGAAFYSSDYFTPTSDTGINWVNRGRKLVVADNGASYGSVNVQGSGLNSYLGYAIGSYGVFMGDGTNLGIYGPSYGNWLLRFDNSGNAYFPQNISAYSDERLKQNKRPILDAAARRAGMAKAAIMYERQDKTHVGFGAQTLELSNPEVVHTADDLLKTKSVNYAELVAVLAVDNDQLAARIATLEDQIATLVATVKDLTSSSK